MQIEHAALWTADLEASQAFYARYFGGTAGPQHVEPATGFRSCFLSFGAGSRLELMQMPGIAPRAGDPGRQHIGLVHLAFAAADPAGVDALTTQLRASGQRVLDEPHRTADGYYESTVLDPDGNRVEIAARLTTPAQPEMP